jgi:hypothetical protein
MSSPTRRRLDAKSSRRLGTGADDKHNDHNRGSYNGNTNHAHPKTHEFDFSSSIGSKTLMPAQRR